MVEGKRSPEGALQSHKVLFCPAGRALCRVPLMSFRMSEPRAKRAGITARVPRWKGRKNKDSACSRPEWQVQHHPGNNTPLQKCTSGASVPVITAWRRQSKSPWRAFSLHLNVCAPSGVDTIGWGPRLSDQLRLLCLISPEYTAAVAQPHTHTQSWQTCGWRWDRRVEREKLKRQ